MALRGTLIIQAGGALNHMIPKWISFFPCEIPKIRSHALACITHYIEFKVCLFFLELVFGSGEADPCSMLH